MRPTSRYLHALREETPPCKINLAGSSPPVTVPADFFTDLPFVSDRQEWRARGEQLAAELGRRQDAPPAEIAFSTGSSTAYTQVLAAVTDPGDTVLFESPTYEPFIASAEFLSLKIRFFQRSGDFEHDFLNIKKSARGVKAIVISNPHCPMGRFYSRAEVLRLAPLARTVIVDEVFYPMFAGGAELSGLSGERPKNFITIGSFTKALGLGALRLGWVRATEKILKNFEAMGLNLHGDVPSPSIVAGYRALKNWDSVITPNLQLADTNRVAVMEWHKRNPGRLSHDFSRGYFGMLKVPKDYKSGDEFARQFLQETGIWVQPGRFFRLPKSVRFQLLIAPEKWNLAVRALLP